MGDKESAIAWVGRHFSCCRTRGGRCRWSRRRWSPCRVAPAGGGRGAACVARTTSSRSGTGGTASRRRPGIILRREGNQQIFLKGIRLTRFLVRKVAVLFIGRNENRNSRVPKLFVNEPSKLANSQQESHFMGMCDSLRILLELRLQPYLVISEDVEQRVGDCGCDEQQGGPGQCGCFFVVMLRGGLALGGHGARRGHHHVSQHRNEGGHAHAPTPHADAADAAAAVSSLAAKMGHGQSMANNCVV